MLRRASGTTTCNPLPPEVRKKLVRPAASSRSRTSFAPSTTAFHSDALARIQIEHDVIGLFELVFASRPGMNLQHAHLHERDEPAMSSMATYSSRLPFSGTMTPRTASGSEPVRCFWKKHSPV